jgi:uncharacterized protein (TIGR00730 family)
MSTIQKICVFCGSSPGARPEYLQTAVALGHALAEQGIGLVYGGANIGVMGTLAKSVLEKGGRVTGVMPKALATKEVAFNDLADLRIVGSMHERKALMADLSDGFIALPGGLGTAEEFIEVLTWAQLGIHQKPCGLINVCGYYDRLLAFLNHIADEQFMESAHLGMVLVDASPRAMIEKFTDYTPPVVDKAAWALKLNGLKN